MDNVKLSEVLAYVLQSEHKHWLEAGEPAEHVYMKALDCWQSMVALLKGAKHGENG